MFKKTFLTILTASLMLCVGSGTALAIETPNFPACPFPGGTLIASYDNGVHGIVGDMGSYQGSDKVYKLSDEQLQQCFCATNGQGIQTNWWKVSSLSLEQIQTLRNSGWNFIPNGALWGLENAPYLAKNSNFSCTSNDNHEDDPRSPETPHCDSAVPTTASLISVNPAGSGSVNLSWSFADKADHYTISYGFQSGKYLFGVPNTGNVTSYTVGGLDPNQNYCFVVTSVNSCQPGLVSNEICVRPRGGEVLGISTVGDVLGLAATGNSNLFYGLFAAGVLSLLVGLVFYKKSSR